MFCACGDAWIPGSYYPETNLKYWSTSQAKPWATISRGSTTHPDSPDHRGHLIAMDIGTGRILWCHAMAATLTTGGALLLSSDSDRNLYIHDVVTGTVLFLYAFTCSGAGLPDYLRRRRPAVTRGSGQGRSNERDVRLYAAATCRDRRLKFLGYKLVAAPRGIQEVSE